MTMQVAEVKTTPEGPDKDEALSCTGTFATEAGPWWRVWGP